MRDLLKNKDYFKKYLMTLDARLVRATEAVEDGKVLPIRIKNAHFLILSIRIDKIKALYSLGSRPKELIPEVNTAVDIASKHWIGNKKLESNRQLLDQYYLGAYHEMLVMLSLGYLLKIDDQVFEKLVKIIDEDNIRDKVIETIISARIKNRQPIAPSDYKHPEAIFVNVRKAIDAQNKDEKEQLLKEHLDKFWYKDHRHAGWYNSHLNQNDIYSGYWAFEIAALTKLMGLDDSSYRDNQYYPADLITN